MAAIELKVSISFEDPHFTESASVAQIAFRSSSDAFIKNRHKCRLGLTEVTVYTEFDAKKVLEVKYN